MEPAKRARRLTKLPILFIIAATLVCLPIASSADCSDSKVKRLSKQGKTTAAIAATCDMDASDVKEILEEGGDCDGGCGGGGKRTGLSPGTPLAPCGCWGPVSPGHREANPACNSGYAMPRMCPQVCPGGGYAWQGICG